MLIPGKSVVSTIFFLQAVEAKVSFRVQNVCKDVCSLWPPTVPLCQTWSVDWSTAMAWDELTFCDGWTCLVETETAGQPFLRFTVQVGQNASLSWPATVGSNWHNSVKLFSSPRLEPFSTPKKALPNRTFAAEESLPTAYKLIELCSLSDVMSLPRGALSTEKNSLPRHACKLLLFWQNVSSHVKLAWKDKCSYTFREYKTRNSKIVTVGKIKWTIYKLERMKNIDVERWETLTKKNNDNA